MSASSVGADSVRTATTPPWRTTRSTTVLPVSTLTPRVDSRRVSASASPDMPPGTVQAPKACSTYDVIPSQAGTLRRSWPPNSCGKPATRRSRSSLNDLLIRLCRVSRVSNRGASSRGANSGDQGRSRYSRRISSQSSAYDAT